MSNIVKADSGYSYKPTAKYSVPLCDESTGYKTIYVTPEYAKIHQRIRDNDWQKFRRSKRCIVDSKHFGKVLCRGNCSECDHARQIKEVSLSAFVDEEGEEFEPRTGEWKDAHEESDIRYQINKEEREREIRANLIELIGDVGLAILKAVYVEKEPLIVVSQRHSINYRTLQRKITKWVDIVKANKERFF